MRATSAVKPKIKGRNTTHDVSPGESQEVFIDEHSSSPVSTKENGSIVALDTAVGHHSTVLQSRSPSIEPIDDSDVLINDVDDVGVISDTDECPVPVADAEQDGTIVLDCEEQDTVNINQDLDSILVEDANPGAAPCLPKPSNPPIIKLRNMSELLMKTSSPEKSSPAKPIESGNQPKRESGKSTLMSLFATCSKSKSQAVVKVADDTKATETSKIEDKIPINQLPLVTNNSDDRSDLPAGEISSKPESEDEEEEEEEKSTTTGTESSGTFPPLVPPDGSVHEVGCSTTGATRWICS